MNIFKRFVNALAPNVVSLKPHSTAGKRMGELGDELAKLTSPQRWYDGANEPGLDCVERKARIAEIKGEMQDILNDPNAYLGDMSLWESAIG